MAAKYLIDTFFARYGDILGCVQSEEGDSLIKLLLDLDQGKRQKYEHILGTALGLKTADSAKVVLEKLDWLIREEEEAKLIFNRTYNFDLDLLGSYKALMEKEDRSLMEFNKRGFLSAARLRLIRDLWAAKDYKEKWLKSETTMEFSSLAGKNHVFFDLGVYYLKKRKLQGSPTVESMLGVWLVYMLTDSDVHTRKFLISKSDESLLLLFQHYIKAQGGAKWALASMKRSIKVGKL